MRLTRHQQPRLRPPYAISTRVGYGAWTFHTACWTLRGVSEALAAIRGRGYGIRVWQDGQPTALIKLAPGDDWEGEAWA